MVQGTLAHGLREFLVARFQVGALFHLAEDATQLFAHLVTTFIAALQEAKGRVRNLAHARVLACTHALFREGLKVFGELDHFGGVRHGIVRYF
jgi:hypothetical protein